MKAWIRSVLLSLITVAFLGLAVAIPVLDGPWYLSLAYLVCAGVTGLLAYQVRPRSGPPPARAPSGADPARRARRSGNPAVRSRADKHDGTAP